MLEIHGATVIVDYGHNADALAALIPVMDKFPHQRRTCVYSTAGDRRDCDMIRQGELLGEAFDQVILYEDHYLRGRAEGEIIRLFRNGVEKGQRVRQIDEIRGADAAVEFALRGAKPGDLILVQADTVDETVQFHPPLLGSHRAGAGLGGDDCRPSAAAGRGSRQAGHGDSGRFHGRQSLTTWPGISCRADFSPPRDGPKNNFRIQCHRLAACRFSQKTFSRPRWACPSGARD